MESPNKRKSENQVIQKLCINRKEENFSLLKEWDMMRASKLMIHRKIIDEIDDLLSQKSCQSNNYIDVVQKFLTDQLNQKKKYELTIVSNPQNKFKNNLAGRILYKNTGKSLAKLHNLTNDFNKEYKKLKVVIQKCVEDLDAMISKSQKEVIQLRAAIEVRIVEIQDINELTLEKCNLVLNVYNKNKNLKPYETDVDLFTYEQQFVYQGYLQTVCQQNLGKQIVAYIDYCSNLQTEKITLLKTILKTYLSSMLTSAHHEQITNIESLQQILSKQTELKYIENCYSLDELLSRELLIQFAGLVNKHEKEVDFKSIKSFLKKLQFGEFQDIGFLVLKEYKIFLKHDEDQEEFQQIILMITVDGFINIILRQDQHKISNGQNDSNNSIHLNQFCEYSIKIDNYISMERIGDITLALDCKKWKHQPEGDKIWLVFSSEDQREEFCQFIFTLLN